MVLGGKTDEKHAGTVTIESACIKIVARAQKKEDIPALAEGFRVMGAAVGREARWTKIRQI